MRTRDMAAAFLGAAVVALGFASGAAQENPTAPLQLSGTYQVQNVSFSEDGTVNMDFSATITNNGDKDLSGKLLLRDYSDNDKVWGRFGSQSISAGGNVTVSQNVTVPKAIYMEWSGGGSPSIYYYTQDSRGDATAFLVPVSRVAVAPSGK